MAPIAITIALLSWPSTLVGGLNLRLSKARFVQLASPNKPFQPIARRRAPAEIEQTMILFNQGIVDTLNGYLTRNNEYVESVLLASYGFNIHFVNFDIQCNERVFASIGGKEYEWNESPNSGPWGALGRQLAKKAALKNPALLSVAFESGDFLDIETVQNQYESVAFRFPPQDGSFVMEVF